MGLHLIVDGYNLIRASASLSRQERLGLEEGRQALLERLVAYKRVKAWPVTVVFDAAEGYGLGEKTEKVSGIRVVYSRIGQTADDIIARMARRMGNQALVVTSDRELGRRVEAAGATAVDSLEFEARLEAAFQMQVFGAAPEEEEREVTLSTKKKGPSRRVSKTARKKAAV